MTARSAMATARSAMASSFYLLLGVTIFGILFFVLNKDGYKSLDIMQFIKRDNNYYNATDDEIVIPINEIMMKPYNINQDNHKLIMKVRRDYLIPPSTKGYNLKDHDNDPSMGQSAAIRKILGDKENGFFIECGALDGETRSNSLIFEKVLNWEGVLIEGDPKNVALIAQRHRKAWTVPACLSTEPYPIAVMFEQRFNVGKIGSFNLGKKKEGFAEVQCLPIYTILLALNRLKVDYFSLDVEGHELEVLRTIPWDKVNITTLSVEYIHGNEGKEVLEKYMTDRGYTVYSEVTNPHGLANDFIFFHPKLVP